MLIAEKITKNTESKLSRDELQTLLKVNKDRSMRKKPDTIKTQIKI